MSEDEALKLGDETLKRKFCRRCLLSEMAGDASKAELYRTMKDYIDSIQDEDRCVGGEYKRRLCVCRECGELFDGMCRLCGCFVEVRAIKKNGSCPHVPSKW